MRCTFCPGSWKDRRPLPAHGKRSPTLAQRSNALSLSTSSADLYQFASPAVFVNPIGALQGLNHSVPNVPFIEFDFVAFQELPQFFLKGYLSMVLLLPCDVLPHRFALLSFISLFTTIQTSFSERFSMSPGHPLTPSPPSGERAGVGGLGQATGNSSLRPVSCL